MALLELNRDPTPRQVRQFGLVMLPLLGCVLCGLSIYRGSVIGAMGFAAAGIASVALTLTRPRWMRALMLTWMWITFPIGWLISHLVLAVIYYCVLTPIGLLMRAAGRDPLERRIEPKAVTYWSTRTDEADPARYFRQF